MFHGICREVSFMNIDEKDETDTTKLCDGDINHYNKNVF
jgi:hypothetical protein